MQNIIKELIAEKKRLEEKALYIETVIDKLSEDYSEKDDNNRLIDKDRNGKPEQKMVDFIYKHMRGVKPAPRSSHAMYLLCTKSGYPTTLKSVATTLNTLCREGKLDRVKPSTFVFNCKEEAK